MNQIIFRDLGKMGYKEAWDYQEALLQKNLAAKREASSPELRAASEEKATSPELRAASQEPLGTEHYLLFVEHPPVYTLGKSGRAEHMLLDEARIEAAGMEFYRTNRGGDITFHGAGQIVGYPILDLEKFYTDIGRYMRELEEVTIRVLAEYDIRGERSPGETGVWIDPDIPARARKICAIGVRCSRWVTMHGFALNVNTDLAYFGNIVPCGIQGKMVTSIEKELGYPLDIEEVKGRVRSAFGDVFDAELVNEECKSVVQE